MIVSSKVRVRQITKGTAGPKAPKSKRPVGRPRKQRGGESKCDAWDALRDAAATPPKRRSGNDFLGFVRQTHLKPSTLRNIMKNKTNTNTRRQGRALEHLPDQFPTREEYRRRFSTVGNQEWIFQVHVGLVDAMGKESNTRINLQGKDGTVNLSLERLPCTLNDMVLLSKTPEIKALSPDQFGVVRSCRTEGCPDTPSADLRRYGRNHVNREKFDAKKVKVVMLGEKSAEEMAGQWYIHGIVNLTTFERIHNALKRRGALPLEDQLLANSSPPPYVVAPADLPVRKERLTGRQLEAIESVCGSLDQPGFHLINGPPGTGKTTTLLEMVHCMCRLVNPGEMILTGSGNATVGDLVARIMTPGSDVLPPGGYLMVVGHQVQIDPKSYPYALFTYLSVTIKLMIRVYFSLKKYLKALDRQGSFEQISEMSRQTEQFSQDIKSMEQLPCRPTKIIGLLTNIREIWEELWTNHILEQITGQACAESSRIKETLDECIAEVARWCYPRTLIPILIGNAYLICCTNSQAMSEILKDWPFKYVLEDEAAQCIEPESLLPLRKETIKAVMIGDPYQLSGFVKSPEAKEKGYGRSQMRRLENAGHPSIMLDTQYRMDPEIASFPARYIYKGELRNGDSVSQRDPFPLAPYELIQVDGKEEFAQQPGATKSVHNDAEVGAIYEWLARHGDVLDYKNVAVITPYQGQRLRLHDALQTFHGITVQTIDGYQGQESQVVILSLVRSNGTNIGFLSELERMNVALTRAQRCFRIVGNLPHFAAHSEHWQALLEDATERGLLGA